MHYKNAAGELATNTTEEPVANQQQTVNVKKTQIQVNKQREYDINVYLQTIQCFESHFLIVLQDVCTSAPAN